MSVVESNSIPLELIPAHCPNCGYALEGLSLDDRCPECGRDRDLSEIVLYGFARGKGEGIADANPSRVAWLVGVRVAIMLFFTWLFSLWYWWFALSWILVLGWELLRRSDRSHPGRLQVRVYPAGVVHFELGEATTTLSRLCAAYFWIVPVVVSAFLIAWGLMRHDYAVVVVLIPTLSLLALFVAQTMQNARHYFRVRRGLSSNAIADVNLATHRLIPWSSVGKILLRPVGEGRYHLQLQRRYRFVTLDNSRDLVDAEVMLTDEGAVALRTLLLDRSATKERKSLQNRPDVVAAIERLKPLHFRTLDHDGGTP